MVIVIGGLIRSGSTWQYNAVRLMLQDVGYSVYGSDWPHYDARRPEQIHLIKEHRFFPDLAEAARLVLTSWRDPRDVRASWLRFRGEVLTEDTLREHLKNLRRWQEHSAYLMQYRDLAQNKQRVLSGMARVLLPCLDRAGIEPCVERVLFELEALTPPVDKDYDPVTFYFKNHRTAA